MLRFSGSLDKAAGRVASAGVKLFQKNIGNVFVSDIKNSISVHFSSQECEYSGLAYFVLTYFLVLGNIHVLACCLLVRVEVWFLCNV